MPEHRPFIAVVDVQWVGSLPTFHKGICRALRDHGCRIASISPKPASVEAYFRDLPASVEGGLTVHSLGDSSDNGGRNEAAALMRRILRSLAARLAPAQMRRYAARQAWDRAARAVSTLGPAGACDLVFFPYLDSPFLGSALAARDVEHVFRHRWSGLLLFPEWLRGGDPRMAVPCLDLLGSRHCTGVALLDEGRQETIARTLAPKPVFILPDLTDERLDARAGVLETKIRTSARGRFTVGLFGELSARKGIDAFLRAAAGALAAGFDWLFVVAGPLNRRSAGRAADSLARRLREAPSNVLFCEGRIEDGHEFNAAIRAVSAVWVVYPGFRHSSNMLTKAALVGRPVVTHDGFLLAERARGFQLGEVVPPDNDAAILAALQRLAAAVPADAPHRQFGRYFAEHSSNRLASVLGDFVNRTCHG